MSRRVMAISAHPDDETLGCGGGLLRHAAMGDELHWLITTGPWQPMFDEAWASRRAGEIDAVANAYGMASVHQLGLPTARLDTLSLSELIVPMRSVCSEVEPDIVYLVHRGDVHNDHQVTFDAAIAALKPFRTGHSAAIYSYECTSSTNMAPPFAREAFLPQVYCDISAVVERKLEILALYETEVFPAPHPRSLDAVRALARYRGATVSLDYAEAYMVIRQVW